MRTHYFTAVFTAINHWFEEAVVETGDEFSIIYIFITLLRIIFTVKNWNKISWNHIFNFFNVFKIQN